MAIPSCDELVADPLSCYPLATIACFDATRGTLPRRELDPALNVRFLERLGACGAPAVLIGASTGHGHLRTVDELQAWLESSALASLPSTMKMALLRPEDSRGSQTALVESAARLGYSVIFVRPGRNLSNGAGTTEVVANMQPLVAEAAAVGLAVGLYSIPDVSGLPMTPEVAARLVDGPGGDRIVAVKVTEANYQTSTLRFLEHPALRHLKIVQGWDPHLATALQDGPRHDDKHRQRCGVTSGPMSFAIYQYLHLLAAAERQDWAEVQAAQMAVTHLFEAMQDDPQRFADLQRAKAIMGLGDPLTSVVHSAQIERVLRALEELPRAEDRQRLARSLDLLESGPYHYRLQAFIGRSPRVG